MVLQVFIVECGPNCQPFVSEVRITDIHCFDDHVEIENRAVENDGIDVKT